MIHTTQGQMVVGRGVGVDHSLPRPKKNTTLANHLNDTTHMLLANPRNPSKRRRERERIERRQEQFLQ